MLNDLELGSHCLTVEDGIQKPFEHYCIWLVSMSSIKDGELFLVLHS